MATARDFADLTPTLLQAALRPLTSLGRAEAVRAAEEQRRILQRAFVAAGLATPPTTTERPSGLVAVERPLVASRRGGGRPRRWGSVEELVDYLALTLAPHIARERDTAREYGDYWRGLTLEWAAERLGLPVPTVRDWPAKVGHTWTTLRALVLARVASFTYLVHMAHAREVDETGERGARSCIA